VWRTLVLLGCAAANQALAQAGDCGPSRYACAELRVRQHRFQEAIPPLEEELKEAPGNLRALNLLGIALTGLSRLADANAQFEAALKLDPQFYPARKNLAINDFTLKRYSQARAHLELVLKQAPSDEVAHLYLAELDFQAKRLQPALDHYERARDRLVENPDWTLHYAACLLDRRRTEDAVAALNLLPPVAGNLFQAGLLLGQAGAYGDAAGFFGLARKGSAEPGAAGYDQVLMLIKSGDPEAAIRTTDELLAEGNRRADLYNLLAEAYLKSGRLQQAYDALRTATQLDPDSEENYADLVSICLDYENFDLGMEIIDIGLRHLPKSWRLHVDRGVILAIRGSPAEAGRQFEIAGALAPAEPLPSIALAVAWMQLGENAKAVGMLREKTRLHRNDFLMEYILGIALVRSGDDPGSATGTEALAAFERSVKANPKFSQARTELGKLLMKRGELDRAIQELETAVALNADDASPAYVLGQAYRRKGDKARSDAMLARVSKLHEQEREIDPARELKRIVRASITPWERQTKN
jgi:Flp pilus assembly protein TadD